MKKRLLLALALMFALAGALSAQGAGYYGMQTSWYPFNGAATFWVNTYNGTSQGYRNEIVDWGNYSDWIDTQAYCWVFPSPNHYIEFAIAMADQCPEGSYISEDGSNGYYPDNPPPNQTANHRMLHNGTGIDYADESTILEILEEFWSCEDYYAGPSFNYDDTFVTGPCLT